MTGSTGYIGSRLVRRLLERGHRVHAAVRAAHALEPAPNLEVVECDVFNPTDVADAAGGRSTLVHLVGTRKPAPWKALQFEAVDLASARSAAIGAAMAQVKHIVYVSVARPAPVMHAYQRARAGAEAAFAATGIPLTVLRPWYVLGPGHRWPVLLIPAYKLLERLPATRASALRLGLVTVNQMLNALVHAVEAPPIQSRIIEVPEIRSV